MDDLGLNELTDDQLVELALAVAREASRRNPALQAALKESLEEERLRIDAAARGAELARAQARARAERMAGQAVREVELQKLAHQRQEAFIRYLQAAAEIIGRSYQELTLVYVPFRSAGRCAGGAELMINAGTAGELARWHLVDYADRTQTVWTSPALTKEAVALRAWGLEVCAAARALDIDRTTTIIGATL